MPAARKMRPISTFHAMWPAPSERNAWISWNTASKTMSQPSKRATPTEEAIGSHSARTPTTIMTTGQRMEGREREDWTILLCVFISSPTHRNQLLHQTQSTAPIRQYWMTMGVFRYQQSRPRGTNVGRAEPHIHAQTLAEPAEKATRGIRLTSTHACLRRGGRNPAEQQAREHEREAEAVPDPSPLSKGMNRRFAAPARSAPPMPRGSSRPRVITEGHICLSFSSVLSIV